MAPVERAMALEMARNCEEAGLTAQALAPALGVPLRTVRRWLKGDDMPKSLVPVLVALLRFRAEATRPPLSEE